MNDHVLQSLLSDKFKLGADATVAAGPVGRSATADTDLKLNAEILGYSRSKGALAGISLDGAVVQADRSGDKAMYGYDVTRQHILGGDVAVPKPAHSLVQELARYDDSPLKSATDNSKLFPRLPALVLVPESSTLWTAIAIGARWEPESESSI